MLLVKFSRSMHVHILLVLYNIVLQLLQKAFKARMIFTIGTSVTSGAENVVVWNDIHHKTNMTGGL